MTNDYTNQQPHSCNPWTFLKPFLPFPVSYSYRMAAEMNFMQKSAQCSHNKLLTHFRLPYICVKIEKTVHFEQTTLLN